VPRCEKGRLLIHARSPHRSFTETILLTTYHKYVTSIALGVVVSGRGTSVYKRPRLHAGSTGRTHQRALSACIDPLSKRGSITATSYAALIPQLPMRRGQTRRSVCLPHCMHRIYYTGSMLLNLVYTLQVAGFMRWRLQQLRSEGSENPAQVLSTARNAIRRVRMVMRGLPQRELTEERGQEAHRQHPA
jgi:hypothetical protein